MVTDVTEMDITIMEAVQKRLLEMRRNFCQACSFLRDGVKTRKAIEHTCGLDPKQWPKPSKYQYIPKREELDKYLERLKELMEKG